MLIGIDLGGTKIEVLLLDADGRECFRKRLPTPQGQYAAILHTIKQLVAEGGTARGASVQRGYRYARCDFARYGVDEKCQLGGAEWQAAA